MHTTEIYFGQSRYCRTRSIQRENLERKFLEYYGVAKHDPEKDYRAFVFPSGMSAISTILQSFSNPNKSIVIGDELYCDTPKVAQYLAKQTFYKSVIPFSQVKETDDIGLVHMETCSNPSGTVPNYDTLREMKRRHNCIISLDNTWLSGVSFNPISKYGDLVDIVVESTSKYISNGTNIGGMCISQAKHEDKLFNHIRMYGIHVPGDTCDKVSGSLETIEKRIQKSSQHTQAVLTLLNTKVIYPHGVECKYKPSVFVMSVPVPHPLLGNSKRMEKIREGLSTLCETYKVPYETSFGGSYSKIDTFPKLSSDKTRLNIRVYVGYDEDQGKLINLLQTL
jgi:cystathionine beta-lyase/cystathionine gamma-synthase